ncbi:MAG: DNA alkylation repair protein [Pseudomonadota bacterium]
MSRDRKALPAPARARAREVRSALRALADPERARNSAWFFKTGRGQYGAGDRFRGIRVPEQRRIARQFRALPLAEAALLLASPYHEDRFTALEILVAQYDAGDATARERIFRFYLAHTRRINNWDLVDTSARYIVGAHLRQRSRRLIYRLARSHNLWERRIAMVSTHAWIQDGDTADAYAIAKLLLDDEHDLIHKAVGWSLRQCGDRSREALLRFLQGHYARLPRTALRYAIEHLPQVQRKAILSGHVSVRQPQHDGQESQ